MFMFPTLVLGPQKAGAASSTVKAEINAKLDLLNSGQMDELAARAKNMTWSPSGRDKSQRVARRAAQLL